MYDDLAKSQQRGPLEVLVVNVLIPSILATAVLRSFSMYQSATHAQRPDAYTSLACPFVKDLLPEPEDVRPRLKRLEFR